MNSLSTAIDAAGGIPFLLQTPLRYQDKAGGLNINLEAGQQWLSGSRPCSRCACAAQAVKGRGANGNRNCCCQWPSGWAIQPWCLAARTAAGAQQHQQHQPLQR